MIQFVKCELCGVRENGPFTDAEAVAWLCDQNCGCET